MSRNAGGKHGVLLLLLAAGMSQFIVCVDYFAVAIALPPMADDLGVRPIDLQWVITGYVISFCAFLAISGSLGDRYGRKKLLLIGIVSFGAVSVWVGLSQTATELVIARIALGVGGGLLFPLGTAVVSHASTDQTLGRNIALLTGVATMGTAVGPVLGGVLTELLSWRWIFFANVPLAALAFVMVVIFADESKDPDAKGRLDFGGILLLVIGIGALSVGLDRIPHWPTWAWALTTGGGVVMLLLFGYLELHIKQPIIDLRLFKNRDFLGFSAAGLLANSAWCMLVIIATLQLQTVLEYSVLDAGLIFLFLSGSVATASFIAPVIERRIGTVGIVRMAALFQVVGIGMLFIVDDAFWISIGMLIAGFGCSWGWAMPQAGAIRTIPRERSGLASGSVLTIMIMSGNTAIVIIAMVIDLFPQEMHRWIVSPAPVPVAPYSLFAVFTETTGNPEGIQLAFLITAATALLGLVPSLLILRRWSPEQRAAARKAAS